MTANYVRKAEWSNFEPEMQYQVWNCSWLTSGTRVQNMGFGWERFKNFCTVYPITRSLLTGALNCPHYCTNVLLRTGLLVWCYLLALADIKRYHSLYNCLTLFYRDKLLTVCLIVLVRCIADRSAVNWPFPWTTIQSWACILKWH